MRKFVYENQGLMKRMYGNQRHYNVLRSEMLNELYDDMFEEMPRRHHQYRRPPPPQAQHNARSARYQKPARPGSLSDKSSGRAGSKHQNSHESIPKHHRTSQESRHTHQSNEHEATESTHQVNAESGSNPQQHETVHPSHAPSDQHRSEHESRAMKLGETAAYSGVRRHHEHVRPRIQSKAPKVRRKLEGPTIITQDPGPSSSSTITTTTTTTATSTTTRRQTTTPTSSSEPGTTTTLEDWTTTESKLYFEMQEKIICNPKSHANRIWVNTTNKQSLIALILTTIFLVPNNPVSLVSPIVPSHSHSALKLSLSYQQPYFSSFIVSLSIS